MSGRVLPPPLQDAFVRRMLQVLRSQPATASQRLRYALTNLQQLHRLLAPFGPQVGAVLLRRGVAGSCAVGAGLPTCPAAGYLCMWPSLLGVAGLS